MNKRGKRLLRKRRMEKYQSVDQRLVPKPQITSRNSLTITVMCFPPRKSQEWLSRRRIIPLGLLITYLVWVAATREQALLIVVQVPSGGKQMRATRQWYPPPATNVLVLRNALYLTSNQSTGRGLSPSSTAQCRPITRPTAIRRRPCKSRRWHHTKRAVC